MKVLTILVQGLLFLHVTGCTKPKILHPKYASTPNEPLAQDSINSETSPAFEPELDEYDDVLPPVDVDSSTDTLPTDLDSRESNIAPKPFETRKEQIKSACTRPITFRTDNSVGAKRFAKLYPGNKAALAIQQASWFICSVLYRDASEVPKVTTLTISIEDIGVPGLTTGGTGERKVVQLDSGYLERAESKRGIDGLIIHELTHVWQKFGAPKFVIEGLAAYTRAKGGWTVPGEYNRKGGSYENGYKEASFFFGYLNQKNPGLVHKMNLEAPETKNLEWFKINAGGSLDDLWIDYQANGVFAPEAPRWQPETYQDLGE